MTTRRRYLVLACFSLLVAVRSAQAQVSVGGNDVAIGYAGLPSKSAQGANTGIQISDGVLMHTGVGVEAGYDSNVFYSSPEEGPKSSPIVRVLPFIEITNATRTGVAPAGVFFDLTAAMVYREYLSSDEDINRQRAFMPAFSGLVEFSTNQSLSLSVADTFARMEDPPYEGDSDPIVRNMNMAAAQLRWAPGGGRLQGMLRYTNTYDNFETPALTSFDSMGHDLMLDLSWRWLPKTAIFLRASQGYITYLDDASDGIKNDSYPLRVLAGIRGLVTRKLSVNLSAGYAQANYTDGPTTSGFGGSISGVAEIGYRPSVLNSLSLGYRHDFQNSAVLGNFYYLDTVYGYFQQQIAGRVAAVLSAKYEHRRFQIDVPMPDPIPDGVATRTDEFVQVGAAVDYHANGWFYTGVGYSMMLNETTEASATQRDASFVKHQILGRIGVTY